MLSWAAKQAKMTFAIPVTCLAVAAASCVIRSRTCCRCWGVAFSQDSASQGKRAERREQKGASRKARAERREQKGASRKARAERREQKGASRKVQAKVSEQSRKAQAKVTTEASSEQKDASQGNSGSKAFCKLVLLSGNPRL